VRFFEFVLDMNSSLEIDDEDATTVDAAGAVPIGYTVDASLGIFRDAHWVAIPPTLK
jgi:hypothetical protein